MRYKIKKISLQILCFFILGLFTIFFIYPVLIVLLNSFKSKFQILENPFTFPGLNSFVGFENYINGIRVTNFIYSFITSVFITLFSTIFIVVLSSMFAWYVLRVKNKITKVLYYLIIFSMIVPFQMVMYTVTYLADKLYLNNPFGIIILYIGFGCGLSVFTYTGYLKTLPIEIEESATIDGASPITMFINIVFPLLKPITVTVSILNAMWIWNDYLLTYLVLGTGRFKTIPVAIQQAMKGLYGDVDWGSFMAMLVLTIIPIVIFYFFTQKYMIKGLTEGSVKG